MLWERSIRLLMRQIMADVCEEYPLRVGSLGNLQRVLYRRVRGMRLVTQSVKKQDIQPFELLD